MKIAFYQTVLADTARELDRTVNQLIGGGWQPYGSPFVATDGKYCQALVMDEKEGKKAGKPEWLDVPYPDFPKKPKKA